MSFEYASDNQHPSPSMWGDWTQECLTLNGWNRMLCPIQGVPGVVNQPTWTFQGDERTGFYSLASGQVGLSLTGILGMSWAPGNFTLWSVAGFRATVTQANTADRTYTLPDESGTLALLEDVGSFSKINDEAFTIHAGQPVKLNGDTGVKLAQADTYANRAVALAAQDIPSGSSGTCIRRGELTLANWATPTGGLTTLTTNEEYVLVQSTAGILSNSAPVGAGDLVQHLGKAITPTQMDVHVYHPMIL